MAEMLKTVLVITKKNVEIIISLKKITKYIFFCFCNKVINDFAVEKVAKYCGRHVCMSVCVLAYLKSHMSILIFFTCHPWLWLAPSMTIMHYVIYFQFGGSWVMSCFRIVGVFLTCSCDSLSDGIIEFRRDKTCCPCLPRFSRVFVY